MSNVQTYLRLTVLAALLLTGCAKEPVSTARTDNGGINVELLFTHEGCRVYRFYDSRYHYFTDCRGSVVSTWTENCGKNCTRTLEEEIATRVDR